MREDDGVPFHKIANVVRHKQSCGPRSAITINSVSRAARSPSAENERSGRAVPFGIAAQTYARAERAKVRLGLQTLRRHPFGPKSQPGTRHAGLGW